MFDFLLVDNSPDCCQDKLKARKDILRKYLDNNNSLELEALFALQGIYVKYNKPAGRQSNIVKRTIFQSYTSMSGDKCSFSRNSSNAV